MTTSGTTAFTLDLGDLIEEAWERCGSASATGYDLRTSRRSLNILFADWANRGVNLWTLDSGSVVLTPGTATYALPADTVDVLDCVIRVGAGSASTQNDQSIMRISASTYSVIPNKLNTGRPIQMLVTRGTDNPSVTVYPLPDNSQVYTFVYWRLRRIQDAGTNAAVTSDIPFRMLPALVAGLAYYLAFKIAGAGERLATLKSVYDEAWQAAADEDREKATVRMIPWVGHI